MCEYCGCQDIPAIARLTGEHDEIRAVAGEAAKAARADDHRTAVAAAQEVLRLLAPHTAIEERGLFPAMAREFPEHIGMLAGEHLRIEEALAGIVAESGPSIGWAHRLDAALAELFEHILREQDGLFPASLSVLSPMEWDMLNEVRLAIASDRRAPASEYGWFACTSQKAPAQRRH